VKTTIELPDDLMREIKVRAAREDRKLKELIPELLRRGLAENGRPRDLSHRVKLPFIDGEPADPGQEVTPERMKQILLDEEVSRYLQR
jgi:plasmid stability protein